MQMSQMLWRSDMVLKQGFWLQEIEFPPDAISKEAGYFKKEWIEGLYSKEAQGLNVQ